MATRNIIKKGDEMLSKKCREVTIFDQKLHTLLDDMKETMFYANGVGLAGPQVAIMRQIAVVLDIETEQVYEVINPKIIEQSGNDSGIEGCLSVPGIYGYVDRPDYIKVEFLDRNGKSITIEATDFLARTFCHEIDHLHGNLFDDLVTEFVDASEVEG